MSIVTCMFCPNNLLADLSWLRRSNANVLAVSERQQLEGLRREQKTQLDAFASVEDKIQQAERQKARLASEIDSLQERDATVR